MKKNWLRLTMAMLLAIVMLTAVACGNGGGKTGDKDPSDEEPVIVTYAGATSFKLVVEGFEWGPSVTKAFVTVADDIAAGSINKDTFVIKSGTTSRTILDAYTANLDGTKMTSGNAKNFVIEMKTGYGGGVFGSPIENSGAFDYNMSTQMNTWSTKLNNYSISLAAGKTLKIGSTQYDAVNITKDKYTGRISPDTEAFVKDTHTYDGKTLHYAAYQPDTLKNDSVKNPLIIWLHGAGEGGVDPDIALLGNEVTQLAKPAIQDYFKTEGGRMGAYVLVPQAPTMWMDVGQGQSAGDNAESIYRPALKNLIDTYISGNDDIDPSRVIIGGCSNGGYMTMNMIIHFPEMFAAAYPICEAYSDSIITDSDIEKIKDLPIWFTHSADDTTVAPASFTNATYARLIRAGAENVHFSYFVDVKGTDSPDITYMGHWSWIYTLKNQCSKDQDAAAIKGAATLEAAKALITAPSEKGVKIDGENVSIWEWLASWVD